jgi:hypothetical protein
MAVFMFYMGVFSIVLTIAAAIAKIIDLFFW